MPRKRDSQKSANRDGEKGYFYAQGKKIPVSRREDLIAVAYSEGGAGGTGPGAGEAGMTGLAAPPPPPPAAGLAPADEYPEMQQSNLRIYKIERTGERAAASFAAMETDLRSRPGVEKVGEVYETEQGRAMVLTDEVVIKFRPEMTADQVQAVQHENGLETVQKIAFSENTYIMRVTDPARNALEIANRLVEQGTAEYAYPNWLEYLGYRQNVLVMEEEATRHGVHPSDPFFPQQWHHENTGQVSGGTPGADIRTTLAWQRTMGNPAIRLAVLDLGIDTDHNDLNAPGKVVSPINLTANPPNNNTLGSTHGTEVSGMAVGAANNGSAGVGSAPNCRLIPIRISDITTQTNMAEGFIYAADSGADVLTCSLGTNGTRWVMLDLARQAIEYLTTYGRNGRGTAYFQAVDNNDVAISLDDFSSSERSIAVSRTNSRDLYDGAARGPELDLSAPGRSVVTITNTQRGPNGAVINADTVRTVTGTSYATPLTAGVALLVLSVNPTLSWQELRQVLIDTADKIDAAASPYLNAPAGRPPGTRNNTYGYGRVNAERAVNAAFTGSPRDLFIRDSTSDDGFAPQPTWGFWDSPDIWVRNADDGVEAHQDTQRGQDNFIYARVWNRGSQASLPCWVRFYVASFAGTQFRYPYDFKRDTTTGRAGGAPGALRDRAQFPAPGTYLLGAERIESIPPGGSAVVRARWVSALIPPAANWHPCLLAEVSPHDGPTPTGPTVWENNNLGQKSVTIVSVLPGQLFEVPLVTGHPTLEEPLMTLEVYKGNLPQNWPLYLGFKEPGLVEQIAALNNVPMPNRPTTFVDPGRAGEAISLPAMLAGIGEEPPLRITFLEETRLSVALGPGGGTNLLLTFPRGSSVEIGRESSAALPAGDPGGEEEGVNDPGGADADPRAAAGDGSVAEGRVIAPPGGVPGPVRPALPAFTVASLMGSHVLALRPDLRRPKVRIPIQRPTVKETSLFFQAPQDARPGEEYTIDVAQRDARGRLVGGVRVLVRVRG